MVGIIRRQAIIWANDDIDVLIEPTLFMQRFMNQIKMNPYHIDQCSAIPIQLSKYNIQKFIKLLTPVNDY